MTIRRLLSLLILLALMRDDGPDLVKLDDPGPMPEDKIWVVDVDGDGWLDIYDGETGWLHFHPGDRRDAPTAIWEGWPATRTGALR